VLDVDVDERGTVREVRTVKDLEPFGPVLRKSVSSWVFEPARRDGAAVAQPVPRRSGEGTQACLSGVTQAGFALRLTGGEGDTVIPPACRWAGGGRSVAREGLAEALSQFVEVAGSERPGL
jgi:hypothetical protein